MADLLPLFVNLSGRRVLVVGGGAVAASKLGALLAAGAEVRVVAPEVHPDITAHEGKIEIERREFARADVNDVWLVVAAATPAVNRAAAEAAEARHVLVNAVDDPANASAFLGGIVRRGGVTLAISTSGDAPGLTALLRQALNALLPREIGEWVREARRQREAWKRTGVPMEQRRPLLLEALNGLYGGAKAPLYEDRNLPHEENTVAGRDFSPATQHSRPTLVSLVGAGPGDPALVTRAAVARLRAADLVLYDALVDERVLRIARHAQRFFVGKRAGRHALAQADIHTVMIRAAGRGRRVVRLKGGDPFVFGRGGEEGAALAKAHIPFEIVPGVTAAIAGPALAGIPVTHRGLASAFLVVSGHDVDAFAEAVSGVATRGVTVVVLMGMKARQALAAILVDRGWNAATAAAIVQDASQPAEHVWRGTLGDLAAGRVDIDGAGPATIVIGDVAALDLRVREQLPERIEQCL